MEKDWEVNAIDEAIVYYETLVQDAKDWRDQRTVEEKIKNLIKRKKELVTK